MNVNDSEHVRRAFDAYRDCALWASDLEGETLSHAATRRLDVILREFLLTIDVVGIAIEDIEPEDIGHDLWLTQNRHGSGFWEGDYPEGVGDALTAFAHTMGEYSLYVADDGTVELS